MTMEIVGNDAQFNEKVTLLKDLEIYGNIKNKTKDTSFDFSDNLSFKIQGNEKLRIISESTTFTDSVTAPSAIFSGIITATNVSVAQSVTANEYYGTFKGSIDPSVADDKIEEGNTKAEVVDTGSDGHFKVLTENTERLRIKSNGYIGIGTDNPTEILDIISATNSQNLRIWSKGLSSSSTLFLRTGDSGGAFIKFGDNSDNDIGKIHYSNGTNSMRFTTNTEERLRITSSGNVGIGSDAPTSKLDVQGFVTSSNTPKAFVNFDGTTNTGGNCTIRDSHNVSSVTDHSTGRYIVNFSTAFANTNYVTTVGHSNDNNNGSTHGVLYLNTTTTGSIEVINFSPSSGGDLVDKVVVCVVVHAT